MKPLARMLRNGVVAGVAAVVCIGVPVAAHAAKPKAAPKVAAVPAGPREIRLVHQLSPEREEVLQKLVARFNEGNKDYRLVVQSGAWSDTDAPHMAILQGSAEDDFLAAGKPRYKALSSVMREAGVPLQALKPPAMMDRALTDAKGQLLALPIGLSTPVMYINRKEFQRAGLNPDAPPKTWLDLQQALGQLFDAGSKCPYTVSQPGRVMIENTSAWHNEPVAARQGKGERPAFNGMLQVKHVAMMASWYRARYLRTFDAESEAEQHFESGECAVIAAPSSSWTEFRRKAGFDIGVAPLPYHDDFPGAPQNTLADGAAMWVAAGKNAAEYKGVARFVAFWLQPENQVAWQRESGYLPLNRAGVFAAQSDVLGADLENVKVAVAQLSHKPATAESSASGFIARARVLGILDEELSAVWADRKPAKEALDTAVTRVQAMFPLPR
ncbi:extracellular solute-binding protein [Azoarcus sp. DN11]|uniref:extracellular solute-binding protein n=1 Tax=Azoarcus sp. DN11 TaxID=356837 RepID=UPI000EB429DA|nr:extracellular solute-binding protein [Azoarcus sp. DN11]AYH42373.1 glycerol-3-phosphate ABC transporter substrate-binding protein [Azoarcus sp. DN11]